MQLVLVPPTSLPIPLRLQTHLVPPPVLDTVLDELRSPRAFLVARRALRGVGLKQENELAYDSTAWWQFAVRSVEWDLEDEAVVVTLDDGTEERWDLAAVPGSRRSQKLVENVDMAAYDRGDDEQDADIEMRDGTTSRHRSPWAPSAVLEHLHALCLDLRSAYEDLGTAHEYDDRTHEIGSDASWSTLQDLSGDPKMDVPYALSDAQTYCEYAMSGLVDDDDSDASQDRDRPRRSARRPSRAASADDDKVKADSDKFTGQFVPQYRPRSTKASLAMRETTHRHDYLSTVHLLTRIRAYLADLFARTVIPKLCETLPATYSLWAASSAIAWCRREAIKLGGEVARLMVDLLEDDGDVFDADSDSESSQPDILVAGEDGEYSLGASVLGSADSPGSDGLGGLGGVYDELAEWRAEERRIQRLSQNVLVSLQGDFELRRWCEHALERARTLAQSGAGTVEAASPRWTEPVEAREVSHTLDGDESDLDEPPTKRAFEYKLPLALRPRTTSSVAASPPTSPPPETALPMRKRARSADDSTASDDSTDSESRDDDDDDELDSPMRYETEFFYPEDPLDEEFLPPRLPKELVRASASRGIEMEEHRARLHELLNKVNGVRPLSLPLSSARFEEPTLTFVEALAATAQDRRAAGLCRQGGDPVGDLPRGAAQCVPRPPSASCGRALTPNRTLAEPKEPTARVPSGLRSTGPSSSSPPAPDKTDKLVPLKAQPLRKQAADRALALSLDSALDALQSPTRPTCRPHVQVPAVRVQSAAPRRKQKSNLETYVKVVAMSRGVEADTPTLTSRSAEPSKKKRKPTQGPSAGGHSSRDPGLSPSKRARKHKPVKREGASAILSSLSSISAQQVFGSSTAAAAAASAPPVPAQDPRHLAALELSDRRRGALAAASGRTPVAWAEDDEEQDEVDERSTSGEDDDLGPAQARSSMSETSKYWDESDSSDDEAVELELVDVGARSLEPTPEGSRLSPSLSPELRPDSPYCDEYEAPTRPGTAAAPTSPSPTLPPPSRFVLPNLAPLYPLSAERSAPGERLKTRDVDDAPRGRPPSFDDEPFVFAPRPRRPTLSILAPASPAPADSSDIASSPASSPVPAPAARASLAQQVRDRLACVADPPVQLVPPLSLDWPDEAAQWYGDDEHGDELVLGLEDGGERDVDRTA